MPKNVLIYGGSFDPPHIAHAGVAVKAMHSMGLLLEDECEVWFMPTYADAFGEKTYSDLDDRLNMLGLLVHGYIRDPRISICMHEVEMANEAGTYAVVKSLMKAYPGVRFRYILGYDQALHIRRWRNSRDLLKTIPFVVINRPGFYNHSNMYWWNEKPHVFIRDKAADSKISSSAIRSAFIDPVKREVLEETIHPHLTNDINRYIIDRGLYPCKKASSGFVLGQSTLA